MTTFGGNLRAVMERAGVRKEHLASQLQVGPTQIDKWLAEAANPRLDTLFRLAKSLGVTIESLLSGVDPEYDAQRAGGTHRARLLALCQQLTDVQARSLLPLLHQLLNLPADADAEADEE